MKPGSIVEYIGGLEKNGLPVPIEWMLQKGVEYLVEWVGLRRFMDGWKVAIGIEGYPECSYYVDMFRELLPPEEIDLEELLAETLLA